MVTTLRTNGFAEELPRNTCEFFLYRQKFLASIDAVTVRAMFDTWKSWAWKILGLLQGGRRRRHSHQIRLAKSSKSGSLWWGKLVSSSPRNISSTSPEPSRLLQWRCVGIGLFWVPIYNWLCAKLLDCNRAWSGKFDKWDSDLRFGALSTRNYIHRIVIHNLKRRIKLYRLQKFPNSLYMIRRKTVLNWFWLEPTLKIMDSIPIDLVPLLKRGNFPQR